MDAHDYGIPAHLSACIFSEGLRLFLMLSALSEEQARLENISPRTQPSSDSPKPERRKAASQMREEYVVYSHVIKTNLVNKKCLPFLEK